MAPVPHAAVQLPASPLQVFVTGADVWTCAIELWRTVAAVEELDAANALVRRLLEDLTPADIADLAVALSVMPRFALGVQAMSSNFVLDWLACEMAWSWDE